MVGLRRDGKSRLGEGEWRSMGLSSEGKGALWFQGATLGQQRRIQEGGRIHVKRENGHDLSAFIGMIFIFKWEDSQYCNIYIFKKCQMKITCVLGLFNLIDFYNILNGTS